MGIGGGSGGSGFKLEKTWRATGVGSTTFNTPGNFTIPFGKYEIIVSGRAGSGTPNTPGNLAAYNPAVPSTLAGYNPTSPSNISGYNTETPGNPTGGYNPNTPGGNVAGYNRDGGGNVAGYNNPIGGGFTVVEYIQQYIAPVPGAPGNLTGGYNPPSGSNLAGYNPYVTGSANYNPGGNSTVYVNYVCEPTQQSGPGVPPSAYVDAFLYNAFYGEYNINTSLMFANSPNNNFVCPSPTFGFMPIPGNIAAYNPPSGGNPNFNSGSPGTLVYFPPTAPYPGSYTSIGPSAPYFSPTCPSPTTTYQAFYQIGDGRNTTFYEQVNYTCPGSFAPSPGTANYNPVTDTPFFNPFIAGNQNYNSPTGGNAVYNAGVVGNAVYNAAGGQNANYNTPTSGVAGTPTNVLGVYFPGGNVGAVAPFTNETLINRYIADDTTYPITVPPGGFVTVQSK